ncbi:putative reverse transcriptase domain-containing protein [Tanacetum coccineum]
MVKMRITKAIAEYEKTRANPDNAGGSGLINAGGIDAPKVHEGFIELVIRRRIIESDLRVQNPNVVTGTFLLNDHYASILFDSGAEKSFVSTVFTPFIDIAPTALDTSYEVELVDGKVVSTNIVLHGCTLALFNHVSKIDLLPTRLGSFDVIVGMDWLSYHHAVIYYYEKIVRVLLPNGKILKIQGERPEKDPRSLSCMKADEKKVKDIPIVCDFTDVFPDDLSGLPPVREIEFRIDLILGALLVVKSPYRLAPFEMIEFSNQLKELQEKGFIRLCHSPWGEPMQFVKKKDGALRIIDDLFDQLQGACYFSKIDLRSGMTNAPALFKSKEEHEVHLKMILELLKKEKLYAKFSKCKFLLQEVQFLGHMINKDGIYLDPSKVESVKNWKTLESPIEICSFLGLASYYRRRWIKLHSDYECEIKYHPGKANVVADALSRKERLKLRRVRAMSMTIHSGLKTKILEAQSEASKDFKAPAEWLRGLDAQFERRDDSGIYFVDRIWIPFGWRSCVMDFGGSWDTHLPLVEFSYNNSYHKNIKCALFKALYEQKCRSPMIWVEVGERKLAPRYVEPFKIVEHVGPVANRLRLPQELSYIHDTFHVSNIKKCLADIDLQVPLEEIKIDNKLYFVEEPVEIVDREVKKLKRSWIPIVKVRWNFRQGAEFTWEQEDQFKAKYPHLFATSLSAPVAS